MIVGEVEGCSRIFELGRADDVLLGIVVSGCRVGLAVNDTEEGCAVEPNEGDLIGAGKFGVSDGVEVSCLVGVDEAGRNDGTNVGEGKIVRGSMLGGRG